MPNYTTSPLLTAERERLEDLLRKEKKSFWGYLIFGILLASVFPFIPTRHHYYWPTSKETYLEKACFCAVFVVVSLVWSYLIKTRNFKRDLALDTKLVSPCTVLKRERSRTAKTFTVFMDSEEKDFRYFNISQAEYDGIHPGQSITLEYAQHSKYLFKPNWNKEI